MQTTDPIERIILLAVILILIAAFAQYIPSVVTTLQNTLTQAAQIERTKR